MLLREELLKLIQPRHFLYKKHFMGQMIHESNKFWPMIGIYTKWEVTDEVKERRIMLWVRRLITNPGSSTIFIRSIRGQWSRAQPILDFLDVNSAMATYLLCNSEQVICLTIPLLIYIWGSQILLQGVVHSVNIIEIFLKSHW